MTREEFLSSDENKLIHLFGEESIKHLACDDNFDNFKNDFKIHKHNILDEFKIEYYNASIEVREILMKNYENFYIDYFLSFFVPKMYVKYFLYCEYKDILIMNKELIIKYLLKEEEYEKIVIFNKIIDM